MYNRNDPRFRRTLNQISQNLESANESAQVGLFSLSENYVKPCFSSISTFLEPCTTACFPDPRDRARRHLQHQSHGRPRGRLEHSFDFYDDWEDDENDALLSLEDDEFGRVVGGYGTTTADSPSSPSASQPPARRKSAMKYGAARASRLVRRKSAVLPYDVGPDPTVIPNQSYFGFLDRLPFKLGRGGLRYKPSAADLQDRTQLKDSSNDDDEIGPLLEEEEEEDDDDAVEAEATISRRHGNHDTGNDDPQHRTTRVGRRRSGTTGSGHTTDSYSSRGDIFPSDDEADAIPFDDEFTIALERRTTANSAPDNDTSSGAGGGGGGSDLSTRKTSGTSLASSGNPPSSSLNKSKRRKNTKPKSGKSRKSSSSTTPRSASSDPEMGELPTLSALKQQDRQALAKEEETVQKNRLAAHKLALQRGFATPPDDNNDENDADVKVERSGDTHADTSMGNVQDIVADVEVADGPITLEDNE